MRKSRISPEKQNHLMELFVSGTTARRAAEVGEVNFKTAVNYFHRLRMVIYRATQGEQSFASEVKVGVSYFDVVDNSKSVRNDEDKVPVLGLLKCGDRIYTEVIPDTKRQTLKNIIQRHVVTDSLLDVSGLEDTPFNYRYWLYKKRHITHTDTFNSIEDYRNIQSFWNQAKWYLQRFNGIPKAHFPLFLKECEWRFNTRDPRDQLLLLKRWGKQFYLVQNKAKN